MENKNETFNELIVIEQLPIIKEQLKKLSTEIDYRIEEALSLECTEETVKSVKSLRASLNADHKTIEDRRKQVKVAVMAPYEQFNAVYEEYVSDKFRKADTTLKNRIAYVEDVIKAYKENELRDYFTECIQSKHIDFVKFEKVGLNITLSATMKSLKEQIKTFADNIVSDLELIETQIHKPEILVEYKKSLNCSQSITTIKARFEAVEREKQRQIELEERRKAQEEAAKKVQKAVKLSQPLEPPKVTEPPKQDDDPVMTVAFKVTHNRSKLKALKQYLMDGGYLFE